MLEAQGPDSSTTILGRKERELRSRFACFPNDVELIFQVYLYIFPSQLNLNPEIVRFDPRTLSLLGKGSATKL